MPTYVARDHGWSAANVDDVVAGAGPNMDVESAEAASDIAMLADDA